MHSAGWQINLDDLDLMGNNITDISPLVANEGIGDRDFIFVNNNPLDCVNATTLGHINTLEQRDVTLIHDCDWSEAPGEGINGLKKARIVLG